MRVRAALVAALVLLGTAGAARAGTFTVKFKGKLTQ